MVQPPTMVIKAISDGRNDSNHKEAADKPDTIAVPEEEEGGKITSQ